MMYLILSILFSTGVFIVMRLFEKFKFDTLPQLVAEPRFGLSIITGFWQV